MKFYWGSVSMLKKMVTIVLAMTFLAAIFTGCGSNKSADSSGSGSSSASENLPSPKIAFSTWVGYGPLFIAKEKGYFQKYGVDPQLTIIEDESQYANAMASNNIQGLCHVVDREVINAAQGIPENLVLLLDQSHGGDGIIVSKDINSIADLKGKTVALDKSTTSYFFFLTALEKNGMKESDVNIQNMAAADAGAAFVAGKIDVAVVWEPWLTNASKRDGGHVILSSAELPNTIVDSLTLRSDFIKEHPEAVKGITQAWYDALEFYKEHPDEGNKIMAKYLNIDEKDIADMVKGVQYYDKKGNEEFFDKSKEDNVYSVGERASKFWLERGLIDKSPDMNSFISADFYSGK